MEIRRETDPILLNKLSNDPDVWANIARHGEPVDWSPIFEHSPNGCIALSNGEDGAQIFEMTADRDFQVVTIFGPTCRGRRALETARAIRDWMTPFADLVFGSIPNALPAAKWFYRQLGGQPVEAIQSGGETYLANDNETLFAFRVAR